jgi:hypothetical protein
MAFDGVGLHERCRNAAYGPYAPADYARIEVTLTN